MRYVSSRTLAKWLSCSMDSVQDWAAKGLLDKHIINKVLHHSEQSLNAFLAKAANCPEAVLTYSDLNVPADQRIELLPASQVARLLNIPQNTLTERANKNQFPALKISGTWRFASTVLEARLASAKTQFTNADIERILGCGLTHIQALKAKGWLVPLTNTHPMADPRQHAYSEANVVAVVERLLPKHHKSRAEEWVKSIRASNEPPLASGEVMRRLGFFSNKQIGNLIRTNILYLQLSGAEWGDFRFRPADILELFLQQQPLSLQDLARFVSCTLAEARCWFNGACKLHDHQNNYEFRHACLMSVLRTWLPAGVNLGEWFLGPFLQLEWTAYRLQIPIPDLLLAVEKDILKALRRPDGTLIVAASTVSIGKDKLLKKLAAYKK